MFCLDLSSTHRNSEYLDTSLRNFVFYCHRHVLSYATRKWSSSREEADLRSFLSRSDSMFTVLDAVSHLLLSFAAVLEILLQVGRWNFVSLSHRWLSFRLDYCGIAILIIGSVVPLLYYQFYCEFGTKLAYLLLIGSLGTACIVISMWDRFGSSEYRVYRACKCRLMLKDA